MARFARFPRLFVLASLATALLCACAGGDVRRPAETGVVVSKDTIWSGVVRVDEVVHVRKGATLTIRPGTRVLFVPRSFQRGDDHEGFSSSGIRVEGKIVAEGTEDSPIVFTVADGPVRPGAWDKILITFSDGNLFANCVFEGARYAIHAHFSTITVHRCVFRKNDEGVRLGNSKVSIEESVFTQNEVRGINFKECRNEIRRNVVTGNEGDGIFLHSKDNASIVTQNAIYGNIGHDLRLGDLHEDDFDAGGNYWGTVAEKQIRKKVFDRDSYVGIGKVKIDPILARPPVGGGAIRGTVTKDRHPVAGASVRAYTSASKGFSGGDFVAEATTDEFGVYRLSVIPGRYYVVGSAKDNGVELFAFPGRNPVSVALLERIDVGLPAAVVPAEGYEREASFGTGIVAKVVRDGAPVEGVSVYATRADADLRGPGEAMAVTGADGTASLRLPPGSYFVTARKRLTGSSIGQLEDGGWFGIDPRGPVLLADKEKVVVTVPILEKIGILGGTPVQAATDNRVSSAAPAAPLAPPPPPTPPVSGKATIIGRPALGHLVFFYREGDSIGRPVARSSVALSDGSFVATLPEPGKYNAWLRKSLPGIPGGAEEERLGPVAVKYDGKKISPASLMFNSPVGMGR